MSVFFISEVTEGLVCPMSIMQ